MSDDFDSLQRKQARKWAQIAQVRDEQWKQMQEVLVKPWVCCGTEWTGEIRICPMCRGARIVEV